VGAANAMGPTLRRRRRQKRRSVGWITIHGPCHAARSQDRSNDGLSTATIDEHPESIRGQLDDASHFLGRQ